jgi:hypothetical protein
MRPREPHPLSIYHTKYHACINCITSYNENADKTKFPLRDIDRYKKGKKVPRKFVWYFPLVPHLQRFFMHHKEAKLMRCHAERKEAVLNYP